MPAVSKRMDAVFLELEPDDGTLYQIFVAQAAPGQPIKVAMMTKNGRLRGHYEMMPAQVLAWVQDVRTLILNGATATKATIGHHYTRHVLHGSDLGGIWESVVMILVAASVAFAGSAGTDYAIIGHLYRERLAEALPILKQLDELGQGHLEGGA